MFSPPPNASSLKRNFQHTVPFYLVTFRINVYVWGVLVVGQCHDRQWSTHHLDTSFRNKNDIDIKKKKKGHLRENGCFHWDEDVLFSPLSPSLLHLCAEHNGFVFFLHDILNVPAKWSVQTSPLKSPLWGALSRYQMFLFLFAHQLKDISSGKYTLDIILCLFTVRVDYVSTSVQGWTETLALKLTA